MADFRCDDCGRDFGSLEALEQHRKDKHDTGGVSRHEMRQLRKQEREKQQDAEKKTAARSKLLKKGAYVAVPAVLIAGVAALLLSQPQWYHENGSSGVPNYAVHWHPKLEIFINGQKYQIPTNLGASGPVHFVVHTHDEGDGTLHYEVDNPTPDNMRLGYFFEKVWRKPFNSTCILEYCGNASGAVRMFVNGEENFGYGNYMPKDNDMIRVEFG